jgi:enterochelin esterase-like enzyme
MLKLRRILLVCVIAFLCLAFAAIAQNAPTAGNPAAIGGGMGAAPGGAAAGRGAAGRGMMGMFGGGSGVRSPEIASDNKVTFRLSAPQATSVAVSGDWGGQGGAWGAGGPGIAMTKDANGLWSVTVGPLDSEMYGYTFLVDGARVWDPANNDLKRDGSNVVSVVIVPGGDGDLYSVKDVPHGTLAKVWYNSPTLNLRRRMYVYTPPGYYDGNEKYPVLYLLHGMGGDEDAWTSLGRATMIFDNLIAQGKVKPMLVVMTNGNANQAASPDGLPAGGAASGGMGGGRGAVGAFAAPETSFAIIPAAAPGAVPAGAARGGRGAGGGGIGGGAFPESIVKDVIPFIEKNFRVNADQKNRAIAGLSMGSMHTRTVTLAHPETFSYYGLFSGSTYTPEDLAAHKATLKYVLMTCGERESMPVANSAEALKTAGFNAESYISPASAHDWLTWRRSLIELAPHLFQ